MFLKNSFDQYLVPVMPEPGGPGGPLAPPIFVRLVNPIQTRGGQIIPTYYYWPLFWQKFSHRKNANGFDILSDRMSVHKVSFDILAYFCVWLGRCDILSYRKSAILPIIHLSTYILFFARKYVKFESSLFIKIIIFQRNQICISTYGGSGLR